MTLEDTTTLSYLSTLISSREAFKYLRKKLKNCLCLAKDQIWLKCRRGNWIRGFPETQSRIYVSSYTENRVCVVADNFSGSAFLQHMLRCCLVSLMLFGVSGGISALIFMFHSLILGQEALMICCWKCSGCTYSGGALALLRIMHCCHYDDSDLWSLSWDPFVVGMKSKISILWIP